MATPSSGARQFSSTAAAIEAAALPAAATKAPACGGRGRCGARMRPGSAAPTAARKLSSRRARMPLCRREAFLAGVRPQVEVGRIGLAEDAPDLLRRDVGIGAAETDVLHMAAVVLVERVEDRVLRAVELERPDAEAPAHLEVEGRRRLDPCTVEPQVRVAVEHEEVSPHFGRQGWRREVVLHVSITDASLDARRA